MDTREKIINAIEKAKKQSEGYAQDRIIVPFKEADMIISLLKEQEEKIKNRDESLEKAREEIKWLRGMLKDQEAVVRCMYCIRRGTYDCPVYVGGDGMHSEPDDWFCADGERAKNAR